jgi:hypothetical protein
MSLKAERQRRREALLDLAISLVLFIGALLFVHYGAHEGWWTSVGVGAFLAGIGSLRMVPS